MFFQLFQQNSSNENFNLLISSTTVLIFFTATTCSGKFSIISIYNIIYILVFLNLKDLYEKVHIVFIVLS